MSGRPDAILAWVAEGTAAFEAVVQGLTDPDFAQPSRLPGWNRAHVVAHVARNADAIGNLLTWARTGVVTPMYADAEHRAEEIEAGAAQPVADLRTDLRTAHERLALAFDTLPDEAWEEVVRTARGRRVLASEVPWMRLREVWVHAVDLAAGTSFAAIPREVCAALIDDVAGTFHTRTDFPPVRLQAGNSGRTWVLGAPGTMCPAVVCGDLPSLAAYATRRPVSGPLRGARGSLPKLPAWL
ncbi:maleylpyruvate isomerase family mycothiol-dependent enzyme [Streptomyces sp. WI04-05B]|uniref:maleylpyruvate isomerase family mycothiol-dependent enzyme n=1 Tax=Streptomyces TaxID=1883 RepID=UPI0029AA6DEC|nr:MULTISPECIES: maleylpyruvate isomerase family mycothiol-dependent enzyme [unclassified Streptomyces]MDX2546987.1 maleylpyruvate isomerase family mycothiol-dependent enzyme [Streptomyces sp. WI04-05B]MDX2589371.1 maleylpyruvate isomerase family mycothiol-dependent enzyme [Streptomyces sp. WI04-05A]